LINARNLSLLCGAAASAIFAGQALAQGGGSAANVEEVIVTGSRTVANGNSSPTPVTVMAAQDLQATTPTTLVEALNKLPSFALSSTTSFLNNASQNYLGAYLNLRGLGTQRDLILLDGRRATPTAADGTVDTYTMPEMLVQRIDVVTGGVSAVYGSDAISGAINYVLDHRFNGVKLDIEGGESTYHDDGSYKLGIAAGTSFLNDRLHVEGSFSTYYSNGVPTHLARPWGRARICRGGAGTAANPYVDLTNCENAAESAGGIITSGPMNGSQFVTNSSIGPFIHGASSGASGTEVGGDGVDSEDTQLSGRLHTQQEFGRADYDLTDDIHAFVQGSVNRSASGYRFLPFGPNVPLLMSTSNPFLTPTEQAQLSAGGVTTFTLRKQFNDSPDPVITAVTDTWNITAGLNGKFDGDRFSWDTYYTHGHSFMTSTTFLNDDEQKLAAGLDATINPANGQIVCRVTLTNPGLYPGCIPINPFGPTSNTDPLKYAEVNTYITEETNMDDIGASVSGNIFDLPAGPLVAALSGEYRTLALDVETPYPSNVAVNCTGLTLGCPVSGFATRYDEATDMPFSASVNVKEVALEATIPLLKDMPFAQSLELNVAGRYTDYSTTGGVETYKLGAVWHPVDDLTLRLTRSQDIRAPSLFDLYQPETLSLSGFGNDVHTGGTNGNTQVDRKGNPNLVPEVAQTLTVGAVLQPSWLPGFSASVDYYHIKMSNAISAVNGSVDYNVICDQSGGTSPYCALFVRPLPFSNTTSANYPTRVYGGPQNVALVEIEGIDFESGYKFDLADLLSGLDGTLSLRGLASYQPVFLYQASNVVAKYEQAGTIDAILSGSPTAKGEPIWKTHVTAAYSTGAMDYTIQYRWRNEMKKDYNTALIYANNTVQSRGYVDLNVTYNFEWEQRQAAMFLSVQNALNQQPVYVATGAGFTLGLNNPSYGGDDVIGRYFTVGVKVKM
jgi:outer membrane receptor protein involved in Fe transport